MKIKGPVWPDMETGQPMEWSDHQIYIITIMPPSPPSLPLSGVSHAGTCSHSNTSQSVSDERPGLYLVLVPGPMITH